MNWQTTNDHWGWLTIMLHWLTAITVFGLFTLGLWMVELDYYDARYRSAPALHKSFGILLFILTLFRLCWRRMEGLPAPLPNHSYTVQTIAKHTHRMLYLTLFSVMSSGYFISTADGRAIAVFDWFSVPAIIQGIPNQEDIAGIVHISLASILIGLAFAHGLAAIKHHFFDRDRTLKRMFGL